MLVDAKESTRAAQRLVQKAAEEEQEIDFYDLVELKVKILALVDSVEELEGLFPVLYDRIVR